MVRIRLSLFIFLFATLGFGFAESPRAVSAQQQSQREEQDVSFRWAFGALVRAEKGPAFVAIKHDTTLKTGDQFKMFVELQKDCFVYVIYQSPRGEIHLLFPYNLQQFSTDYQPFKQYYIPQDDGWFELDEHVGRETFYLLASAQQLIELERLLRMYKTAEPAGKQDLAKQILTEIRKIKRRHRKFKTFAERPVQTVGNIRGGDDAKKALRPDVSSVAVEISAKTFYSRTFTIDHQ